MSAVATHLNPPSLFHFVVALRSSKLTVHLLDHFDTITEKALLVHSRDPLSEGEQKSLRTSLQKHDWVCLDRAKFALLTHQRSLRGMEWAQHDVLASPDSDKHHTALARIAARLYHHGAVYSRCEEYDCIEADEAVSLVSVPTMANSRLLFSVSVSVQNVCDPGCFCAGKKIFSVKCYEPKVSSIHSTTKPP